MRIVSKNPSVKLTQSFDAPMKSVVAAARTCYVQSPVLHENVDMDKFRPLAQSIYDAGHHTTYQHPTFQFLLEGVSRQFVWSSLHSHPFYNCLDGTVMIRTVNGKDWSIAELYAMFSDPAKKHYIEKMLLKSVDNDGVVVPGSIKAVVSSGEKPIYEMKTKFGYAIRSTTQHQFMVPGGGGYVELGNLKPGDTIVIVRSNSKSSTSAIVESITPCGSVMTYDIEMAGPHHNFIANNFCVHNSEQVSQRYVPVKAGNCVTPELPAELAELYEKTSEMMFSAYETITALLNGSTRKFFHERFNAHPSREAQHNSAIKKKCQEVARYVLPISTHTNLYHTVSGLTLQRYWRGLEGSDCPAEARIVFEKMIDAVLEIDPEYAKVLESPADSNMFPSTYASNTWPEIAADQMSQTMRSREEFDNGLGSMTSELVSYSSGGERVLADAVRGVLGWSRQSLSDSEAIDLVMNPSMNKVLGEKMNMTTMDKLSRAMHNVTFTFKKRLSHTGDSQDQRHRMTPGSRPILSSCITLEPDYHTPGILLDESLLDGNGKKAIDIYHQSMQDVWKAVCVIAQHDIEAATYLLPNAVNIRFTETGDLSALWHKYKMRLCYNAQEEIWRASVDEVSQIRKVMPRIGSYLLPPCGVRSLAKVKPVCPEGPRYCGIPVWLLGIEKYDRVI